MRGALQAPRSIHGSALPIPQLDFSRGLHTYVDNTMTWPVEVSAGAYQITATVGVFVSQSGEASPNPGSAYIAAGVPFHLLLEAGTLSVIATGDDPGDLFVVPLR
ncbi:hypothetical protein PARHAE_03257 [Paracoccus haematequi]|uniref:Uncharacterized protein n=2 Tax=Paracoccus haematequi TaxID=2491866 RepID=A0A447IRC9_9RHOB|nr:hypothetical protein PARHAE_03257 [Paracoccus haematequi]